MLTALGATPDEDGVYRYLAAFASATAEEIGAATRLSPEALAAALSSLTRRGLVNESHGRFIAAPPDAVEQLLHDRLHQLWSAQAALADVVARYHARQRIDAALVEVVTGDAVGEQVETIQDTARSELLVLSRLPVISFTREYVEQNLVVNTAVKGRVVYDTELLNRPGWLKHIDRTRSAVDEYRAHPAVPLKLVIADRSIAVLPLSRPDDSTPAAAVVHAGGILHALIALFEQIWAVSLPLIFDSDMPCISDSPIDQADRSLLSFLVVGLTDEAIAARHGVSTRTIQRRVHALMLATGARTRMQLAWQAAHGGWLSDQPTQSTIPMTNGAVIARR